MRSDHLYNLDITCLTVGLLRTVWKVPFDRVVKGKFYGKVITIKSMMYSNKKVYNYYEDQTNQVIEFDLYDGILSMGIVLPKQNKGILPQLSQNDYETISESIKPTQLQDVAIPEFKVQSKIRISNILKKTGLTQIFSKAELPELLSHPSKLTDFVQNFTLIVENKSPNQTQNINIAKNSVIDNKFIADKPFMYYFKLLQTKTLILVGQFYG